MTPTSPPNTPYARAKQEWDNRMGNSLVQAKNWRGTAIFALLLNIILAILLCVQMATHQDNVYIAEVTKAGRVVNVAPLRMAYEPNDAQVSYFIGQFITNSRSLPLDPIVARNNWLNAYSFLTQSGSEKLNALMKETNPSDQLGKKAVTIKVVDVNRLSAHTYQLDWVENTTDLTNQSTSTKNYSGVFTIMIHSPTNEKQILENPLGIYISDFTVTERVGA